MTPLLIDTPTDLAIFLDELPDCKGYPPSLYVDLEGNKLSRHGTISLVTILVHPRNTVHLVDVTALGEKTFTTEDAKGGTLKRILESEDIIKAFFDIRHDSDALFALYGVRVGGICDLQLMQLATRNFDRKFVNGLAKCIERDSTLSPAQKLQWKQVKNKGCDLFDPTRGGSYAVFDERPLSQPMMEYCTQDVVHMPDLWKVYWPKLCDAWWEKIINETERRIKRSQMETYNGQGSHMAAAPPGWAYWQPKPDQRAVRVRLERQCGVAVGVKDPASPHSTDDLIDLVQRISFRSGGLLERNEVFDRV